ncbi:hypothetical protein Tco_1345064 [Tanacetum coccineum]
MLEKGNFIPWESRFRRFLDNNLKEGERMWRSMEKGPYVRPMIPDDDTRKQIIEPLSKITEINKKQYIADVRFSTPNNNRLSTSSIIRNQAVIQDGRVDIQTKNAGYDGNGNRNAGRQNRNQAFNAGNRNDKIFIMARIQPADDNTVTKPNYDAKAVSEVNASHKILVYTVQREAANKKRLNNELKKKKELLQKELETCKEWVKTYESNMIQCSKYKETCEELEREIRADKDTIKKILKEKDKIESDFFKIENEKIIIQHETQIAKKAFKEQENRYHEDIIYLKKKLSSRDRIVYKMGQSIQTIHMLGKTPNKVYDPFSKLGANDRPLMLEKGNYIPWESRFRRFLDNKLEDGERMWCSIQKGPYVRPMICDPDYTT